MLHKLRPNRDLDQCQVPRRGNHHCRGIRRHGSLLRHEILRRFLGLGLEDTVPDATSLWLFRETLATASSRRQASSAFS